MEQFKIKLDIFTSLDEVEYDIMDKRKMVTRNLPQSILKPDGMMLVVMMGTFFNLSLRRMTVYSRRAPKTKMMQAITQHSIAVRPSA